MKACVNFRFPVGAHVVGAFIMPCGSCFYCSKVLYKSSILQLVFLIYVMLYLFLAIKIISFIPF